MSNLTFSLGKAQNVSTNSKSLFGNDKTLFNNNNENLSNIETGLFKYNQNQKIFANNTDTSTTPSFFGNNIINLNNNFVNTTTEKSLFNFGNDSQNKPLNTQQQFNQGLGLNLLGNNNKNLFKDINNNQGILGNNLRQDNNNSLWKNINRKGGVIGNNNKFQEKPSLFSDFQNNEILFPNFNNNPKGNLLDNNKSGGMKLFNDNNNFTLFSDNNKEKKQESLFFNNDKSLFNNNEAINKNKNFSIFGTNNDVNQGNKSLEIKKQVDTNKPKSLFGDNFFKDTSNTNLPTNNPNNLTNIIDKNKDSSINNFPAFKKPNNISFFGKKDNFNIGESSNFSNNNKINNNSFQMPMINNNQNFIFENDKNNNNKDIGLWENIDNTQSNNNINNNIYNNAINNYSSKENISFHKIFDPFNYFSSENTTKFSSNDEISSNKIQESIEKQKNINQFLDDLEQKYNKQENNDDYINNRPNDILDNYGTYLENSGNFDFNKYEAEPPLLCSNESFKSPKENQRKINNEENSNIYNMVEMNNSLSKINNIYEEYEKYKNQFIDNPPNKTNNNLNVNNKKINNIKDMPRQKPYEYQSSILGRNEALYNKNIMELDKLSKNEIKTNDLNYIKGKKEIVVKNNENDIVKWNNSQKIAQENNIDLTIKYNVVDIKSSEKNTLIIKNINPLIKIKSLKTEIENKILNELKAKNLDQFNHIENISLYMLGNPLLEENSLKDYDLKACDFTIDAFINYKKNIINKGQDKLVPLELVPKLTKAGYKCNPSILELSRKTEEELKKVEGFRIYNKYGEVEFMEPINLLGLNLDEQVTIEPNAIDTGDKLDYNSKFKLYNFIVPEEGLNKYKTDLKKYGGNFLEYKNNEIVWEYNKNEK